MYDVFVIAEAGVNHNGRLDYALELVDAAAHGGADAVKFQTFTASSLTTEDAPLAAYQARNQPTRHGAQHAMLQELELDAAAHKAIAARCRERNIEFMSTPFDVESVALLNDVGVQRLKVGSGEIDNPILLRAVARTGKPLILSSGMSTLSDIEYALSVVAREVFASEAHAEWSESGYRMLAERVSLLHCTTEYPAPASAVNLRAIQTMSSAFRLPVGYSDHTDGVAISCAAVALGATIIEKHITLDRNMPGPDHRASLEVSGLATFVAALRDVAIALGDGRKVPASVEIPNIAVARRSVVAVCAIGKGEKFTAKNLALKRPGTGIPASRLDELIGSIASRDYYKDELIER